MPETVSIIRVTRLVRPVAVGVFKAQLAITYARAGGPPRIVYIDADKDSEAERKRAIAEDIKESEAETPSTLDIA